MASSEIFNEDCMIGMARYPDKSFDLAIVDPPYGIGKRLSQGAGKLKKSALQNMNSDWDIAPSKEYFQLLFKKSKHQIIFGGNYFILPPTRGIICWDKKQFMPTFSRWEYAWTSFDCPAKMFDVLVNEIRIHPTQKPIALYDWLLANYAKPGFRILDTHLGSGSSRIACDKAGLDFVGFELDKDYFKAHCKRWDDYKSQIRMF